MKIKCAAILYEGRVYEGERHDLIGYEMLRLGACRRPYPGGTAQGFVTDSGQFVGRSEALKIALEAGQVTAGTTSHPTDLFSEDLRYCRFHCASH